MVEHSSKILACEEEATTTRNMSEHVRELSTTKNQIFWIVKEVYCAAEANELFRIRILIRKPMIV